MSPLLLLVTAAAVGVEVGWEPLPEGGHEYTILIEPQLLSVLARGTDEIFSEVPSNLDVRRYRIRVGTGKLPRDAGPPAAAPGRGPAGPTPAKPPRDDIASPSPADTPPDPFDSASPSDAPTDAFPGPTPKWEDDATAGSPGEETTPQADPLEQPPVDAGPAFPAPPSDGYPDTTETAPPAADQPDDDWALDTAPSTTADAQPPTADAAAPAAAGAPGKLPPDGGATGPIEQAGFNAGSGAAADTGEVETQKPELPEAPARPWTVLLGAVALLCCSLGANAYLGWIAWDARHRYRDTVAKLRTAT